MACIVTTADIKKYIKQEMLNLDGVKPIPSGLFFSFNKDNPDTMSVEVLSKYRELKDLFQVGKYGDVLPSFKEEYGFRFDITPSQELADAMTLQNIKDEEKKKVEKLIAEENKGDFYKGDEALRFQELGSSRNFQEPVTDNYSSYLIYKENLLNKAKNELKEINVLRNKNTFNRNKYKGDKDNLVSFIAATKNDIDNLKANNVEFMFHAIIEDMNNMSELLDNLQNPSIQFQISSIGDNIDFLHTLIKGKNIDGTIDNEFGSLQSYSELEDRFKDVNLQIDNLVKKYQDSLSELTDKAVLDNNIVYNNNIKNKEELDLKSLFSSNRDISWLEKMFLGVGNSTTEDSIIPALVKAHLEQEVAIEEAVVKAYTEKLQALVDKVPDTEDFLEKTNQGNYTGRLIGLYSDTFNNSVYQYRSITDKAEDAADAYRKKIMWLTDNVEVIDFRKLKAVQDIYGDAYSEEFTFSSEEMDRYEKFLQDNLGPMFEDELDKVLNQLALFEENKENFLSSESEFKYKDIARESPWEFIKHFKKPVEQRIQPLDYNGGGINTEQVYSDVKNIRFFPLKSKVVGMNDSFEEITVDTGYYNSAFEKITQDSDKLELWKTLREIYADYINPVYGIEDMSYAKFEKERKELVIETQGMFRAKSLFQNVISDIKGAFYEKGQEKNITRDQVISNYSDAAKRERQALISTLKKKSDKEIQVLALENGIDASLSKGEIIKEYSFQAINNNYSTDIAKNTIGLLNMAALQKAQQRVLPAANLLLDRHRKENKENKNSIERLQGFIERRIQNKNEKYRGKQSFLAKDLSKSNWFLSLITPFENVPFVKRFLDNKKFHLLNNSEKEILKHLNDLKERGYTGEDISFKLNETSYASKDGVFVESLDTEIQTITEEEFANAYEKHIVEKINSIGLDLNLVGIIQGIMKAIIFKGLGLNPISGIFNRIEGKNSSYIMDATGEYWTIGNINKANSFLTFANLLKFTPEKLKDKEKGKLKELSKFQAMLDALHLVQDRKNELQRANSLSRFEKIDKLTNIYQFSVDHPEYKNQGAVILSVWMDTYIENPNTGEKVQLFNGKEFPAHDLVDGNIVLKEEFRSPQNISQWEKFQLDTDNLENNEFFLSKLRAKDAVNRSQGNYDELDVQHVTKTIWGRAATLFTRWMGSHFEQRFASGKATNIYTGKAVAKGRYRSLWDNVPSLAGAGAISLLAGFGFTPIGGLVGLGLTGVIGTQALKKFYSKENINSEISAAQELVAFMKSFVIESLNYPLSFVNLGDKANIKNNAYKDFVGENKMTAQDVQNLQSVTRELGVKLTWIAVGILAKSLLWDDEDDKESSRRKFANFTDNQVNKIIGTINFWQNPMVFSEDIQRIALLTQLKKTSKVLKSLAEGNEKDDLSKNIMRALPLPSILTNGTAPWQSNIEFEGNQWWDKKIKDYKSEGEWTAEKKYLKVRKDARDKIKENLKDKFSGDKLKSEITKQMNSLFTAKDSKESYRDAYERSKNIKVQ